jgi:hypothetical protein
MSVPDPGQGFRIQGMMSNEGHQEAHEHDLEAAAEEHRRKREAGIDAPGRHRSWWKRLFGRD